MRIASVLRTRILRGRLKPGERVPGIDDLCGQYCVARATARQALQMLVGEKLIASERGRGSTVIYQRPPLQEQNAGMFQVVGPTPPGHVIKVLARERCAALPEEFGLTRPQVEAWAFITNIHYQAEQPYGYFESYIDATIYDRFPRGADTREKLFVLMNPHTRVRLVSGHESLVVQPADWQEARHLEYQMGMPVVHVLRTMWDKRHLRRE